MSGVSIRLYWWQGLGIVIGSVIALYTNSSVAQITPDGTLPSNSNVRLEGNTRIISGGTTRGANLFHSFSEFSVPTGQTALFNNALNIQNILTRVTGKSISNIDGLIRSLGTGNLFLINPNGIVFGQNARLDIGGSFVASTASSLKFGDGFEFSTTNSQSTPLLSINVPIGLQFGSNPGKIQVIGDSQKIRDFQDPIIHTISELRVQPNQTLALVGGDVSLNSATLKTPGGRIELGSVTGNGLVSLTSTNPGWLLGYQGITNFQNIRLTDGANIAVNGDGKGSIAINANNIDIHSGSNLKAGIDAGFQFLGTQAGDITLNASGIVSVDEGIIANEVGGIGNGGNINITGRSLFFSNGAILSANSLGQGNTGNVTINARDAVSLDNAVGSTGGSVISANLLGTGNGGKITINAPKVSLLNGATVVAHTYGSGNAGSIEISAADDISINGVGTGVGSQVFPAAVGNGGTIAINAPKVSLLNGATIVAHTNAQGNAGSITINVNKVFLDGVGSNGESSGLGSAAFQLARGNGGVIIINTDSLAVTNGASLFASSFGEKDAGSVTINATGAVSFDGVGANGLSSNAFSTVELGSTGNGREIKITANSLSVKNGAIIGATTSGQGNGGNININVSTLQVQGGGQILTTSRNRGNAGDISVNATDSITIIGSDQTFPERLARIGRPKVRNEGAASGIFANTDVNSTGSGGNINVTTRRLSINEGALINATSQGTGVAGNINAKAGSIRLDNNATISANTQSINTDLNKPQATINIRSRDLILLHSSNITTDAKGENVIGGDIKINTDVLAGFEDSNITANSTDFRGGNVRINTKGIFGLQFRDTPSLNTSDITATGVNSESSGNVQITTPDIDLTGGLIELPTNLVDVSGQISTACTPGSRQFQNSFVSTGRGGLPMSPTEPLQDTSTLSAWVRLKPKPANSAKTTTSPQPTAVSNSTKVAAVTPIVEASGWIVDSNGNVELVAQAPGVTPHSSWQTPASCQNSK